jgi:hypothetical protein
MPDPSPDAEPDAESEAEESPAPYANRAERRAKGKAKPAPAVGSEGWRPGRSGTVQSPRQYGNRRSG